MGILGVIGWWVTSTLTKTTEVAPLLVPFEKACHER
jgi:hypothetical protein